MKQESYFTQGICTECGVCRQMSKGKRGGKTIYMALCCACHKQRYSMGKYSYTAVKGDSCELCGFTAAHPCQLDVDHVNGNHSDDSSDNLQTLCANCHRLKTNLNQDWG